MIKGNIWNDTLEDNIWNVGFYLPILQALKSKRPKNGRLPRWTSRSTVQLIAYEFHT